MVVTVIWVFLLKKIKEQTLFFGDFFLYIGVALTVTDVFHFQPHRITVSPPGKSFLL